MEIFVETIERELPELAREGVRRGSSGGATAPTPSCGRRSSTSRTRPRPTSGSSSGSRSTTAAGPSSAGRPPPRRGRRRPARHRRERDRRAPLRARDARARPAHPHLRRAAHLELPPLAARLHGAGLRRHPLARLRRAPAPGGARRVREPPPALRRPMSSLPQSDRRRSGGAAPCPLRGLLRPLGALRPRRPGRAARAPRALPDGALAAAARARRLRRRARGRPRRLARRAEWMVGGFMVTILLAFVFAAVSETRQSTTVAVATTVLGAAWIGLGLGHLLAPAGPRSRRPADPHHRAHHRLRRGHVRLRGRQAGRPPQDGAGDLARQDVGGVRRRARGRRAHALDRVQPGADPHRRVGGLSPSAA